MNTSAVEQQIERRIKTALWDGAMTRLIKIGSGALGVVNACLDQCFESKPVMVIADPNTYSAAGRAVQEHLRAAGRDVLDPYLFEDDDLYAEYQFVERLQQALGRTEAIPIAVGSGTINDLTKLAAHQNGRPYLVVGTAASMDGYTAFGASITREGYKQTIACPAPRAVVVDLDVLAAAPQAMNAAGYADLIAKVSAGADWILADRLGVEPINPVAWDLVQSHLRDWVQDPAGIRRGDRVALAGLIEGLLMTGLSMQRTNASRPASGAEHQFSHLWDMQHHTHLGASPMHGYKVAIGTIASAAMYEWALARDPKELETDHAAIRDRWPAWEWIEEQIRADFPTEFLAEQVIQQSQNKYLAADALSARLARAKNGWLDLATQLGHQLFPAQQIQSMLAAAGAPHLPEEIGISRPRLRQSFSQARCIRTRYTILDFILEAGWWDPCINALFDRGGFFYGN